MLLEKITLFLIKHPRLNPKLNLHKHFPALHRKLKFIYQALWVLTYREYYIDPERRMVFFVISKNAGSSILTTFFKEKFKDNYSVHGVTKSRKIRSEQKDYFKFAVVRNPFDRVYSCYKNKWVIDPGRFEEQYFNDRHFLREYYLREISSFADFVRGLARVPHYLDDRHLNLQHPILFKGKKCLVDSILRFETLGDDFRPIQERFRLGDLPHFNRSQVFAEEWKNHYTEELAGLMYQKYRKDFDTWYPEEYDRLLKFIRNKKTKP